MKKLLILLVLATSLFACKKEASFDAAAQAATDDATIQSYISANKLTNVMKDPSGLYYQIVTVGTGANATASSTVTVNYTGKFTDNTVFDSGTINKGALNGLIKGWIIGVPYCKVGGRILLLIPSALGYGHNPSNGFRSDAVTIFTIDLISAQ